MTKRPRWTRGRIALALAVAGLCLCATAAESRADAYLRVISQTAPVHTGPGSQYRQIFVASRGDVFEVRKRGSDGYWFLIELDDGTSGWVFGELVFPFDVDADRERGLFSRMWLATRRAIFGPPPAPHSDVEISFSAGALDREGVFLLRPAYLIEEHWAFEGFLGLSPRAQQDLFMYGAGWTFRLLPGSALGPHVNAGFGGAYFRPKPDNPVGEPEHRMALSVGGGFELTFKKQITVRLDFRNWTIFDANASTNAQEYSGGLAIFF